MNTSICKYLSPNRIFRHSFNGNIFSKIGSTFSTSISNEDNNVDIILESLISKLLKENHQAFNSTFVNNVSFFKIEPILSKINVILEEKSELEEFDSQHSSDMELKKIVCDDLKNCQLRYNSLKDQILDILSENQMTSNIDEVQLEVNAGVGGQESMLFAQELMEMYKKFCIFKGWIFQTYGEGITTLGGLRRGTLIVKGPQAYETLIYEGGIHRVQRVPKTDNAGRVHTSTASVAVLPQPSEVSVEIMQKDLKIEAMRASGAGGQHVNTTDSAVRITHLPTGVVTDCQVFRFQEQNRKEALKKLRSILFQREIDENEKAIKSKRKLQIGTRARSEKIRTYNFNQDRVTDHRLGFTVHNLSEFLNAGLPLQNLISKLVEEGKKENLLQILKFYNDVKIN